MSFPRYPAYKATGMDWLGEVPEHWSVNRLKLAVDSCTNGVWGDEAKSDENDVMCIRVADFDRQSLAASKPDEPTIRNVSDRDIEQRSLRNGDLLIEKSGGGEKQPVGAVVLYTGVAPAVCSNFVARMRLKREQIPSFWKYVHHAVYSVRLNTKSIKQTSGIQNLDQQQYLNEIAAYPPLEEQLSIANFLDHETAKIDALIAEQERLIELLQEKRQAVISHAVTKGLNPSAPMKDSGVEWLGEIPEHWITLPVRRCLEVRNNLRTPIDVASRIEMEGEYPYYGPTGILSYIDRFMVEGEHFLIGEDGDHFLKFEKLPMSLLAMGKFNVNNHAHLLKGSPLCLTKWGALFFEHKDLDPWLIKQGVGRYKLRKEKLMEIPITIPPLDEQQKIIETVEIQRETFSQAVTNSLKMIELLKERRSALISAAVTGQIDVRDLFQEEVVAA